MPENTNPQLNLDGMRRYEELVRDIEATANRALGIAIANSIAGSEAVLGIEHGGTGSATQNFVDLSTNQFNIHGSKIFHDSCGFQNESDIVDSGELAGNVRLICCDPQGADVGSQLRFSGRYSDSNLSAFAFGTIAGRKYSSISDDKSGYLQFASTNELGNIVEGARLDHEQTFGIGTSIPVKGLGNRLWLSGGDALIDRVGGSRSYKLEIHSTYGRMQAVHGFDQSGTGGTGSEDASGAVPGDQDEHLFLSVNARFESDNLVYLDEMTKSAAAIQLKSFNGASSEIRLWVGESGASPVIRQLVHSHGIDVFGDILAVPSSSGHITAGGVFNLPNGVGNNDEDNPGIVTGDNLHFGDDDPENNVNAPIGALYGRRGAPTENQTVYAKTSDDYGPTGWTALPLADLNTICVASNCPDPNECTVWYDEVNQMIFYWHPDAKSPGVGAWISQNVYQVTQKVPVGEAGGGKNVAEERRGRINKHYVYFTPTHTMKNRRHEDQKFDMYLQDLVATLRVRNNGRDPVTNYYLFDLVTLQTRQGAPQGGTTKSEWPGDRAADDDIGDNDGEESGRRAENITGFGHSYHPTLSNELIARTLTDEAGVVVWEGTFTDRSTGNNTYPIGTKKFNYDPSSIICNDLTGVTSCPTPAITRHAFRQNLRRDTPTKPWNPGYVIEITSGSAAGEVKMILDNTGSDDSANTIRTRRPFEAPIITGDTFKVYSREYRRVITRVSTKGNVHYPNGPYSNRITKDVQDFVETGNHATVVNANDPDDFYPDGPDNRHITLEHYIPLVDSGDGIEAVDAVIMAGVWDAIGRPGKLAGSISLTYRLALPFSGGSCP